MDKMSDENLEMIKKLKDWLGNIPEGEWLIIDIIIAAIVIAFISESGCAVRTITHLTEQARGLI